MIKTGMSYGEDLNMSYVHYWHFQKAWYAKVNDDPNPERVFWHNNCYVQDEWNKQYLIEDSAWLTHGEIKKKLTEMYSECILVKDSPFHQGARWRGFKGGSREGSMGIHKKPIKERNTAKQISTQE